MTAAQLPLQFTVPGIPILQGSMTTARGRIYAANSPTLRPWRASVTMHAVDAKHRHEHPGFTGPVRVQIVFWLPRPKTLPKKIRLPSKRPDLDKLTRAILDALTDAAIWVDDAQVQQLALVKYYASAHPPGAAITIEPADVDELEAALARHPAGKNR
jgi:crossover junction endodeoxyribonuclease RusA